MSCQLNILKCAYLEGKDRVTITRDMPSCLSYSVSCFITLCFDTSLKCAFESLYQCCNAGFIFFPPEGFCCNSIHIVPSCVVTSCLRSSVNINIFCHPLTLAESVLITSAVSHKCTKQLVEGCALSLFDKQS